MAIPDFQSIMLPLLELAGDGKERSLADSRDALAEVLGVGEEERRELLPSGTQPVFNNRIAWASIYLHRAGLLKRPQRGWYQISDRGLAVLEKKPERIDIKFLSQFSEFREFKKIGKDKEIKKKKATILPVETSPEEILETAYQELQENLASELLENIKRCLPSFFERLVVDVLIKMGYGGSRKEAGQAVVAMRVLMA